MSHKDYCMVGCKSDPPTQKELAKNHGTPREFEQAVMNAIGEISVAEALDAIRRYEREYRAAK